MSVGVILLRRSRPDLPRGYRVPLFPLVPVASVGFCLYLIVELPAATFELFAAWIAGACAIYFTYSVRHSMLAGTRRDDAPAAPPPGLASPGHDP